ncbi:MAG: hypothetical protein R2786_01180 [Flavobacteriaceae bacterium]
MKFFSLTSNGKLTQLVKEIGISTWDELVFFVKNLPYGRNSNRTDFSLVLTERKGTCSSKHGFLKEVAMENGMNHVKLMLVLFKMNGENTPKLESFFSNTTFNYIPEAHTLLRINGVPIDATHTNSDFSKIEKAVISETEIQPKQLSAFKTKAHKEYLKNWIATENITHSLEAIWKMREHCIEILSK